jgi:hypothetical protein
MASITISDLNHSESSLHELTDEEVMYVTGGFPWGSLIGLVAAVAQFLIEVL